MKRFVLFTAMILFMIAVRAQRPADANFVEANVKPYLLPDVLRTSKHAKIRNKADWENNREQLLDLFEENIYGQMPKHFVDIKFSLVEKDELAMQGKATMKKVSVEVFNRGQSVKINLILFVPNHLRKAAPAFLLINNRGQENTDPTRRVKSGFWPAELAIDSGYAIAAFHVSDAAPDDKESFMNGVLRLYPEQLAAANGMRAIGAWAWAASRIMDYFEQDPDVNADQVILVGHSRGGKAALWAAAQDQRFASCISNCSGNTGAALSRRNFGESVKVINTNFPHWFTPNYKQFNDREAELPVDQHMLLALIAPRPLYVTNASEDLWADPTGTYLALKHAESAYALYGLSSRLPEQAPAINQPILNTHLAYHNRAGIHDLTIYEWRNFIRFANFHFKN
ncbi:glucuronyl esterase domain-containing protein [Pedobacter sp. SAFR-022]|uniref:glucuronyl esterase domain-containing protein n=1 Tax=Pedobacter sp. SAFR-022 TaxID=3436861 RepID=UPI003F7CF507